MDMISTIKEVDAKKARSEEGGYNYRCQGKGRGSYDAELTDSAAAQTLGRRTTRNPSDVARGLEKFCYR